MRIGELAQRCDVSPPRSLRYYEEQHLLQSDRHSNGYRDYPPESAVESVKRIRPDRCGVQRRHHPKSAAVHER